MQTIRLFCEDCETHVEAYADWQGYHEGANQFEIVQGVAAGDDIHVDERHDLSTIG